jgi:hypothetical protein
VVSLKANVNKMGILLFFVLILITACSTVNKDNNLNSEISSEGSYKAILFVNDVEYQSVGETAKELGLVPGELIGTVKEKIDIEIRPTDELTSNYLKEGTEIYSVDGNIEIVLSKKENGEYEVFE